MILWPSSTQWQFCHRGLGGGAEEVGPMCLKSIHVPYCLTKPTGLTTEHALSEPVTPSFHVLPASAAGPAAGIRWCLWVVVFALGILGIGFYKRLVLTGVSHISDSFMVQACSPLALGWSGVPQQGYSEAAPPKWAACL